MKALTEFIAGPENATEDYALALFQCGNIKDLGLVESNCKSNEQVAAFWIKLISNLDKALVQEPTPKILMRCGLRLKKHRMICRRG